jgi:hypothetical protein
MADQLTLTKPGSIIIIVSRRGCVVILGWADFGPKTSGCQDALKWGALIARKGWVVLGRHGATPSRLIVGDLCAVSEIC